MLLSDVRWDLIQVGDVIISEFGMPGKIINLSENSWKEKIIYIKMDKWYQPWNLSCKMHQN